MILQHEGSRLDFPGAGGGANRRDFFWHPEFGRGELSLFLLG